MIRIFVYIFSFRGKIHLYFITNWNNEVKPITSKTFNIITSTITTTAIISLVTTIMVIKAAYPAPNYMQHF